MSDLNWDTFWDGHVEAMEERTGIERAKWRIAGRKTKDKPHGEDLDWWRAEGLRQVEEYRKWLDRSTWQIATMPDGKPGIEWEATVSFGGVPVQLIVDGIFEVNPIPWADPDPDGMVVVDYKTGSRTPPSVVQLGLYASAIERAYGFRPKWGAYLMTRSCKVEDIIDLSPWSMDFFDYHFSAMQESLMAGRFPASVGDHCNYCGFSEYCFAVNGAKSFEYPMRIGKEENK